MPSGPAILAPHSIRIAKPRAHWEALLIRLSRRLEEHQNEPYNVPWKLNGLCGVGQFRVEALFVFGSFARGALNCGDVDLILSVTPISGALPLDHQVKRATLGSPKHCQVVVEALPDKDWRDREECDPHHLVWSRENHDVRSNLACIPIDPAAGRFARKTDALPFPLDALRITRAQGEAIVDLLDQSKIRSTFVPFSSIELRREAWNKEQLRTEGNLHRRAGKATRAVAPPLLQYMFDLVERPHRSHFKSSHLRRDHVEAFIGKPSLRQALAALRTTCTCTVLIVPYLNRSWTPGIWCIERGPAHDVTKVSDQVKLWVPTVNGQPMIVSRYDDDAAIKHADIIEGFTKRQAALESAESFGAAADRIIGATLLCGETLSRALGKAEVLCLEDLDIPTRLDAMEFFRQVKRALKGDFSHYAMSNIPSKDSGVRGAVLWIKPGPSYEKPSLDVVVGKGLSAKSLRKAVSVKIESSPEGLDALPPDIAPLLRAFIRLNLDVLLRHWRGELGSKRALNLLQPI